MEEACGLSPQRCEFESRLGYKSRKRLVYAPVAERNTHCAKDAGFEGSNPSGCTPVWWNGIHTCFRNKVFWVRIPVRVRRRIPNGRGAKLKPSLCVDSNSTACTWKCINDIAENGGLQRWSENKNHENRLFCVCSQVVWQAAFNRYIAGSIPVRRSLGM